MVNGYVNTESNYFMDSRLNLLNQSIYNVATHASEATPTPTTTATDANNGPATTTTNFNDHNSSGDQVSTTATTILPTTAPAADQQHTLIDILRVYYEFGPMICGLVNLIDFVPRFYSPTPTLCSQQGGSSPLPDNQNQQQQQKQQQPSPPAACNSGQQSAPATCEQQSGGPEPRPVEKVAATESLTRLIRRSLAWFECERKRILRDTSPYQIATPTLSEPTMESDDAVDASTSSATVTSTSGDAATIKLTAKVQARDKAGVDIKCCNLQVCRKIMLKNELIQLSTNNALDNIQTRTMSYQRAPLQEQIVCHHCCISTNQPVHNWCQHLVELCQPYELRFVRLAYVVPVYNLYARSIYPLRLGGSIKLQDTSDEQLASSIREQIGVDLVGSSNLIDDDEASSSSDSSDSKSPSPDCSPMLSARGQRELVDSNIDIDIENIEQAEIDEAERARLAYAKIAGSRDLKDEDSVKEMALGILQGTNERLLVDERSHQLGQNEGALTDAPIGQLSYRLFAPCQLVNSSSCFSINPVNSSSPLSRRGSLDLNGSGLSSDNAHPSTLLLGGPSTSSAGGDSQQAIISFGAMFPALSHDIMSSSGGNETRSQSSAASKFTTNEFEPVDAIRRRMEVYVTTNSMKVIAGETLIVNLSDVTSCLSTAIERTVVKAHFAQRTPSTWASVYILYAAVDEPLLPAQLLASQKQRELTKINEEPSEDTEQVEENQAIFDDDFKGNLDSVGGSKSNSKVSPEQQKADEITTTTTTTTATTTQAIDSQPKSLHGLCSDISESIKIEENADSSLTLYNSAYDRTVALPTRPDNQTGNLEPVELMGSPNDCLWLDEADIIEAQQRHWLTLSAVQVKKHRKRKSKKKRHEDSQCSIM